MELRHLRYFIAVAEEENVSRAALKLHVSQPALSRQIRDLEDDLGFSLFERSAKAVRLTEAGRVFLVEARAVRQRIEQAVDVARRIARGGHGELQVGYAPSLTARILPPALRAFRAEAPGIQVKLHDLTTEEMLAGLRQGGLHVAFLVRPAAGGLRGLQFQELTRDALRLAVGRKHPWARRRSVRMTEVVREPLVVYSRDQYPEYHELLARLIPSNKRRPRVAEEHDSVSSLIAAVEAGSGVALVPESLSCFSGPRLKLVPLTPEPPPLVVGAAWLKGRLERAAERFVALARARNGG